MKLYYQVRDQSLLIAQGEIETPFQIGRQNKDEIDLVPVCISTRGSVRRLLIVKISDVGLPRQSVDVDFQNGKIVSTLQLPLHQCAVRLGKQMELATSTYSLADGEVTFLFNNGQSVRVSQAAPSEPSDPGSEGSYVSLAQLRTESTTRPMQRTLLEVSPDVQNEAVTMIRSTLRLYNEVPGSAKFFESVADTVRNLLDVQRVLILNRQEDAWQVAQESQGAEAATSVARPANETRPHSSTLVNRVLQTGETQIFEPTANLAQSMLNVQRAVASPIFDDARQITAILYGDKGAQQGPDQPISLLQASLMDVVAQAISTALIRQRDAEFRTTTGQFFSKSVLERLSKQKDLLEGRDAEVSILFCDIRGFSRIAHKVGPAETIEWINDVLTNLSECVLAHDGVVVDYVGDAVMAMFGAPEHQSNHASRACRAACQMLSQIPQLNMQHQELTEGQFGLGIGINSGIARVGNTGSRIKFKYGPLGSTVNMASRVESITKKFGVPCLITDATRQAINSDFASRRISCIRVQGISDPVEIYQLMESRSADALNLCQEYERALGAFESENITDAIAALGSLLKRWLDDMPSKLLLQRCTERLTSSEPFDRVWTMDHK